MTKAQLITEAAINAKQDEATVSRSFEAIIKALKSAGKRGDSVFIRGFGSFMIVQRAAKIGRNIHAGKSVVIPAKKVIKFKPAPEYVGL